MALIVKDNRREWTPAPEGLHQAVCVDVQDLGLVETQWGQKPKVLVIWQIEAINPDTGKRHEVRGYFNQSISEKSRLRATLEAWRGRKFTAEELAGFDMEKLVGAPCQVQVVHNLSDEGRIYANAQAVVPAAKGVPKLSPLDYVRIKDRATEQQTGGDNAQEDAVPF